MILARSAYTATLADKGWVELDPADIHELAACDPDEILELAEAAGPTPDPDDDEGDLDGADDVTFGVPTPTTDPTEETPMSREGSSATSRSSSCPPARTTPPPPSPRSPPATRSRRG